MITTVKRFKVHASGVALQECTCVLVEACDVLYKYIVFRTGQLTELQPQITSVKVFIRGAFECDHPECIEQQCWYQLSQKSINITFQRNSLLYLICTKETSGLNNKTFYSRNFSCTVLSLYNITFYCRNSILQ